MKSTPSNPANVMNTAMHANLAALAHQLKVACKQVTDAQDAMQNDERNLAIGAILPLDRILPECVTLLRSVIALQSWHNNLPTQKRNAE